MAIANDYGFSSSLSAYLASLIRFLMSLGSPRFYVISGEARDKSLISLLSSLVTSGLSLYVSNNYINAGAILSLIAYLITSSRVGYLLSKSSNKLTDPLIPSI